MTFVNEYVSEKDAIDYGLDALAQRFNERAWRRGRPPGFRHMWTIDRERKVFLLEVASLLRSGPSGQPEPGSASVWCLRSGAHEHIFKLDRLAKSSRDFSDRPYLVCWRLSEHTSFGREVLIDASLISLIKEALKVHGAFGAMRQIEQTVVEVKY